MNEKRTPKKPREFDDKRPCSRNEMLRLVDRACNLGHYYPLTRVARITLTKGE